MVALELSKIVVVTINVIFMIFGLAFLVIGIVFRLDWTDIREAFVDEGGKHDFNLQEAGDTAAYAAIVFGCFIILVSLLGCVGACCRVKLLLIVYAVIVMVLLISKLAIVAYVGSQGAEAVDKLEDSLADSLDNYYENSTNPKSKAFSVIFSTFECCAINGSHDFDGNLAFYKSPLRTKPEMNGKIPITCCHGVDYENLSKSVFANKSQCLLHPDKNNAYTEGCLTKVKNWIEDSKGVLIGVGVAILLIELLSIILAFYICCTVEKDGYLA